MAAARRQLERARRQPERRSRPSSSIEPASQSDQPDASQTRPARRPQKRRTPAASQTATQAAIVESGQTSPASDPFGAASGQLLDLPGLGQLPETLPDSTSLDQTRPESTTLDHARPLLDIKQLVADPENRRLHNPRNVDSIVASLKAVGTARSIVVDEDNVILAGNGVREAAAAAGVEHVRIIDAEGDELIAVRRRGLTVEQKRLLAMYDNRTSELATWNVEQLQADHANGLDLKPFFFDNELTKLIHLAPASFTSIDETLDTNHRCPSCGYEWSGPSKPARDDESSE